MFGDYDQKKMFTKKFKEELARKANIFFSFVIGLPLIFGLMFLELSWLYDAYNTGFVFVGGRNCKVCYVSFEDSPVSFVFHVVAYIFMFICCAIPFVFVLKNLKEKFLNDQL